MASAATLMASGGLADRFRARLLALAILALYAGVCVAMARVEGPVMLALVIFGLRFCGQGMMSQIAMTAMGRWFRAQRGRAVAIAGLGYSLGESLLPLVGVGLMWWLGWRTTWLVASVFLLLLIPLMLRLLADERTPQAWAESHDSAGLGGRHWTRREAMAHWLFWPVTAGVLGPPLIGTSLFFQQARIAEAQEVSLATIAGAYPVYAILTVSMSFVAGWLVDRFSARMLLPFYQLPMATGCLVLAFTHEPLTVWATFALFGIGQGTAVALLGALWPELYGTRHIGAIRGTAVSTMVFATGLGPGLTGGLLDLGVPILWQFAGFGVIQIGICAGFAMLLIRAARLDRAGAAPA
jgi:MFS family permease